jgi:hypothetical protein
VLFAQASLGSCFSYQRLHAGVADVYPLAWLVCQNEVLLTFPRLASTKILPISVSRVVGIAGRCHLTLLLRFFFF